MFGCWKRVSLCECLKLLLIGIAPDRLDTGGMFTGPLQFTDWRHVFRHSLSGFIFFKALRRLDGVIPRQTVAEGVGQRHEKCRISHFDGVRYGLLYIKRVQFYVYRQLWVIFRFKFMILRGGHVIYGFSLAVESEDNVGRRGISTVWCVCWDLRVVGNVCICRVWVSLGLWCLHSNWIGMSCASDEHACMSFVFSFA